MFNLSSREAVSQDRYNCLFNLSLMHAAMSAFTNYSPGFDLWQSGLFNLLNPRSKWTSSAFSMGYYSTKCHRGLCAAHFLALRGNYSPYWMQRSSVCWDYRGGHPHGQRDCVCVCCVRTHCAPSTKCSGSLWRFYMPVFQAVVKVSH